MEQIISLLIPPKFKSLTTGHRATLSLNYYADKHTIKVYASHIDYYINDKKQDDSGQSKKQFNMLVTEAKIYKFNLSITSSVC